MNYSVYHETRYTLWNIAKKFYTTVDEIIQMNDLDGDEVSSGTPLLLVKKVEE